MKLVLMRHAERQHDVLEREAPLTDKGLKVATETSARIKDRNLFFTRILCSEYLPARATAERLPKEAEVSIEPIDLLNPDKDFPKWPDLAQGKPFRDKDIIAIVGHHPGISNLLISVTGWRTCRRVDFGEAVLVNGTPREIEEGKGNVRTSFGSPLATLKDKIQAKMTVCTFLAGFTIAALVELLKDLPTVPEIWEVVAVIAFTFSLAVFVGAILAFDILMMPSDYWGPINLKMKPNKARRDQFALNFRMNGAVYAYMVRIWRWLFGIGIVFLLVGFMGMILKSRLHLNILWNARNLLLVFGTTFAVILSCFMYWLVRPRLGIDD